MQKKWKKIFCGNSNKYFGTAVSENIKLCCYKLETCTVPGQPKFVAKNVLGPLNTGFPRKSGTKMCKKYGYTTEPKTYDRVSFWKPVLKPGFLEWG